MESHGLNVTVVVLVLFFSVNIVPNQLVYAKTTRCDFPAIFNFGDSNSDTGGLSAAFGQVGPPSGESYFGGPAGRYSDGRLVIDFIGMTASSTTTTTTSFSSILISSLRGRINEVNSIRVTTRMNGLFML